MQLSFFGGAQTVTGSRYLLEMGSRKILVDCGLFQGVTQFRHHDREPFPVPPSEVDAVILTHAHIDHSGYLPLLVKNGFSGKIYCSLPTLDLCNILLPDSGYLQEEEAKFANRHGYSKHKPALPLYTKEDAEKSLGYFRPLEFCKKYRIGEIRVSLFPAGHILGASFVQIQFAGQTVLFSGDLGRPHDPIMLPPTEMHNTDFLILESTYGDRLHDPEDPLDKLGEIVRKTSTNGGSVIIPAFAVGRAQDVLYLLYQLKKSGKIPDLPVYLDSPMAKNATDIFRKYAHLHRLPAVLCQKVCDVATCINSREESKALDTPGAPKIIISASGMLEGGRVLHHVRALAPDAANAIVFTGYQAMGTRGAELIAGKKSIRIFGGDVPVNASVYVLHNMSAHADYAEILQWLAHFRHPPRRVFITHGEPAAALSLCEKITDSLHWQCIAPKFLQTEKLDAH